MSYIRAKPTRDDSGTANRRGYSIIMYLPRVRLRRVFWLLREPGYERLVSFSASALPRESRDFVRITLLLEDYSEISWSLVLKKLRIDGPSVGNRLREIIQFSPAVLFPDERISRCLPNDDGRDLDVLLC